MSRANQYITTHTYGRSMEDQILDKLVKLALIYRELSGNIALTDSDKQLMEQVQRYKGNMWHISRKNKTSYSDTYKAIKLLTLRLIYNELSDGSEPIPLGEDMDDTMKLDVIGDNALDSYQQEATQTDLHNPNNVLYIAMLGLLSELGEVSALIYKPIRKHGVEDFELHIDDEALADEIGDMLWYLAILTDALGYDLSEIAQRNIAKLNKRSEEGTLDSVGTRKDGIDTEEASTVDNTAKRIEANPNEQP